MSKLGELAGFIEKSVQIKICSKCGESFPLTEEYWYVARPRTGHKKAGWQSNCKVCWKEVNRINKLRRKGVYNN